MTGSRPPGGRWIITSPRRRPRASSAGPPDPRRLRPGGRRGAGRRPGPGQPGAGAGVGPGRADQLGAWTRPPRAGSTPGSSRSPRPWKACCDTTVRGARPSPATPPQCRPPGTGDLPGEALALSNLGDAGQLAGDYPGAAQNLQEALGICRERGDRQGQALALTSLGNTRRMSEDYPGAARDLQEALGICRDLGDRPATPTPSTTSGSRDCRPGSLRARLRICRRRWASAATSATGSARPASSSGWGRHSGYRGLSGRGPEPAGGAGHLP